MATKNKKLTYQKTYLVPPVAAFCSYLLLLIVALLKQHNGSMNFSFVFLGFWGSLLFFVTLGLGLLGLVHRKGLSRDLLLVNIAVSAAIIVLMLGALTVLYNNDASSYACSDSIRCLIKN